MRSRLTRILAPAGWALRAHWVTVALLAALGGGALLALLAVSVLVSGAQPGSPPRLVAPVIPTPDLQLPTGALMTTPADVRAAATDQLFQLLLLVAGGVFLVAAFSVAAVAAARAAARASELTVRRAVGASRRLLLAAALIESAVIVAVASIAGGGSGVLAGRRVLAAWPGPLTAGTVGSSVVVVLAIIALTTLGVVVPVAAIRRRMPLGGRQGRALELALPTLQLGVSLTVLAAAALLTHHAERMAGSPLPKGEGSGVRPGGGAVHVASPPSPLRSGEGGHSERAVEGSLFEITVPQGEAAERAAAYARLLSQLRDQSAAKAVSLSSPGTLIGLGIGDGILTDCGQCIWGQIYVPYRMPYVTHYLISADTFGTLGLPIIAGRGITDADRWGAPRVAVVNRSLAADDFQDGKAVGRRIQIGHAPATWYTVVGVVADQLPSGFGGGLQRPPYAVYLSVLQHPAHNVELLLQAPGDSETVAAVPRTLRATLGDRIQVTEEPAARRVAREAEPIRWFGRMFAAEGWMMLAFATLGTFVVMWLWVASLLHDLGVRRSVGARRRDVLRFVFMRVIGVTLAAVVFGLWCGEMLWSELSNVIAGLPSWEPSVLLRYSVLLLAATFAGALLPAWRAARAVPVSLIGQQDA